MFAVHFPARLIKVYNPLEEKHEERLVSAVAVRFLTELSEAVQRDAVNILEVFPGLWISVSGLNGLGAAESAVSPPEPQ